MKVSVQDRFDGRVMPVPEAGCWLWTGCTISKGYGCFWDGKKNVLAHRFSFQSATKTLIPAGMCVCHKCDTPLCVNPAHLFLGTNDDNVADRERKLRNSLSVINSAKTHCPKGHEYAGKNLYIHNRQRHCRACQAIFEREKRARIKLATLIGEKA